MEEGILITQDKREIEVFFLKPQYHNYADDFQPLINEPNIWVIDDPEIAQALIDDNKDCCEELKESHQSGPIGEIGHKGHKGVQGSVGVSEEEADMFEAISECLEKFSVTNLALDNSDSRDILSITITRKIKNL